MERIGLIAVLIFALGISGAESAPKAASPAPAPAKTPTVKSESDDAGSLSGKVVETMDASGYTYVCLEKNGKKTWVAVPQTNVAVGSTLSFQPGQPMTNFQSKALNRTFETIIFSGGIAGGSAAPAGHGAMQAPDGPTGSTAQVGSKDATVKVEKAEGKNGYTVAEVYAKSASLNKKTIAVRGKVVKVSAGIMGKNWVHLQDGTGDQKKSTHNLVATTQDRPAVGDVVTATGKFAKDRDFGAGYLYKAIIEDARIAK